MQFSCFRQQSIKIYIENLVNHYNLNNNSCHSGFIYFFSHHCTNEPHEARKEKIKQHKQAKESPDVRHAAIVPIH